VPNLTTYSLEAQCLHDGVELNFGAETKHIQAKGFTADKSTNLIERFHGILKDRTKVMRGLKKKETARLLMDGWLVHYNFFRPHEALDDFTPAEKAEIKFPYKDWQDVTRLSMPSLSVSTQKTPRITGESMPRISQPAPRITPPRPKLRR